VLYNLLPTPKSELPRLPLLLFEDEEVVVRDGLKGVDGLFMWMKPLFVELVVLLKELTEFEEEGGKCGGEKIVVEGKDWGGGGNSSLYLYLRCGFHLSWYLSLWRGGGW